jgi:DNA primase
VEDALTFENTLYTRVFEEFGQMLARHEVPTAEHFTQHPNPEMAQLAVNLFSSPYLLSEKYGEHNITVRTEEMMLKRSVLSSLNSLKLRKLERMILQLQEQLKTVDEDGMMPVLEEIKRLHGLRRQLSDHIGTIVLK